LQPPAEPLGQPAPGVPVVLRDAVLERDDRELVHEAGVEVRHPRAVRLAALETICTGAMELTRRGIERDRHCVAMPRTAGGLEDRADRLLARAEIGRKASLVADPGREPAPVQHGRSEEHTSELQSLAYLVCRLLLEKKNKQAHY